jgi:hypothetical protein
MRSLSTKGLKSSCQEMTKYIPKYIPTSKQVNIVNDKTLTLLLYKTLACPIKILIKLVQ